MNLGPRSVDGGPRVPRMVTVSQRAWLRGLRLAVVLTLGQSVALALMGLAAPLLGPREPYGGNWEELIDRGSGLLGQIASNWQRWDALWYQHIALFGYGVRDGSAAFYPLYPLLSRALSLPSGDVVRAELLLSGVASIGAAWFLWKLSRLEVLKGVRSDRIGGGLRRRAVVAPLLTVLLTALFPTGFFFLAPYTESLFLCLTVASFWLMRTGRLWPAGVVAFLASLTRAQGILLALPIAYEAIRRKGTFEWVRRRGGHPPGVVVLAALLPVAGALAFASYQVGSLATGQIGIGSQAPWGFAFVMPWQAFAASFEFIGRNVGKPAAIVEALNVLSLGVASVITIASVRRIPPAYSIYALSTLGLYFFRTMAFSPLMSVSRFVLVVFPCFMVAGMWFARRPRLAAAWLAVSFGLQLLLYQYWVRWGFVA